ncbi:MAG: ATP-binding protein [Vicinamibacterales bacterium]
MTSLSLRGRLTLGYSAVLMAALVFFGVDLYWVQGRVGVGRVDAELQDVMATLAGVLRTEFAEEHDLARAAAEAAQTVEALGGVVAILDAGGATVGAEWRGLPEAAVLSHLSTRAAWTLEANGRAWRLLASAAPVGGATVTLLVGAPLDGVRRQQDVVREALLVAVPIAVLVAGSFGWWLAALALRPISDMAASAARMSVSSVGAIGEAGRTDELGLLARTFNALVARLGSALETQRRFMADASHELRTPVSVIRATVDVALSQPHRSEPEYRDALASARSETERLGRLVDDMLVLARVDAGGYELRPAPVYLDEILADVCRAAAALGVDRGVSVELREASEMPATGDESLLRRLFENVVHNAVRHSPDRGVVEVTCTRRDGRVEVRVVDGGPGVPAADVDRIFDRFVQLDPARRTAGAGLGLPIARWVAEAHGGTLTLERRGPRGTTFLTTLPV